MANTWENSGNSDRLYFLGLQNHCRWYCSHEIKRHLLLGRKAMTNLDSILKGRDIALLTKVHLVEAMVFPVVMYGCESWTINKVQHRRIDAFELWCWRRLLRVPWAARRSNQSILKEISLEYSLERLILKLKLQCNGHLMRRTDSLEKTLMLGKIEDRRRRGRQRMRWDEMVGWHHWLNGHEFEQALGVGDGQGSLACCSPMESQRVGHDWVTLNYYLMVPGFCVIVRKALKTFLMPYFALSVVLFFWLCWVFAVVWTFSSCGAWA